VIQSWDTAAKQGLLNSFSVCTTWLVHQEKYYLLHVWRRRMTFPQLVEAAEALADKFKPRYILIEDASSGSGLADTIKGKYASTVRLIKSEHDKQMRLYLQQAKFEQRRVLFPNDAPWLRVFLEELLSFPECTHSDQVDSVSQALAFKAPSGYTAESIRGMEQLVYGLAMGRYFR
jgi:predicted phage terminase large subunit-like protein